jgi:hypothetical protein
LRWLPSVSTACSSTMKSLQPVSWSHAPRSMSSWLRTYASTAPANKTLAGRSGMERHIMRVLWGVGDWE